MSTPNEVDVLALTNQQLDDRDQTLAETKVVELGDIGMLNRVQAMRLRIVDALVAEGVPTKVGNVRVLSEVLSGIDNSIFARKRAEIDEQNASTAEAAVEMAKHIRQQLSPDFIPVAPIYDGVAVDMSLDDTNMAPLELVPGQTDIGVSDLDYDNFIENMDDD